MGRFTGGSIERKPLFNGYLHEPSLRFQILLIISLKSYLWCVIFSRSNKFVFISYELVVKTIVKTCIAFYSTCYYSEAVDLTGFFQIQLIETAAGLYCLM